MITHWFAAVIAAAAQALSSSFNIAETHFFLSIIIIQQAQSTQFRTLKLEFSHTESISISFLSLLPDIKNSVKLKEISNMKLTDLIFHEWKNMMLTEFKYYSIDKIIVDSHDSFIISAKFNHWLEIEQLFIQAFTTILSVQIYKDIKIKIFLQDK